MSNLPLRNLTVAIGVKKHTKVDTNFSSLLQFYCISLICSKYFVRDCSLQAGESREKILGLKFMLLL